MTRDDIIRMAREAGIVVTGEAVWRLCELVAAAECEACAKVCDEVECGSAMMIEERHTAAQCARKIRARGET